MIGASWTGLALLGLADGAPRQTQPEREREATEQGREAEACGGCGGLFHASLSLQELASQRNRSRPFTVAQAARGLARAGVTSAQVERLRTM